MLLDSLVDHSHSQLVRQVERKIDRLPTLMIPNQSPDDSANLESLEWIVGTYANITGISYLPRKLNWILGLDSNSLAKRNVYDSVYTEFVRQHASQAVDSLSARRFVDSLHVMTDRYASIDDSSRMASTLLIIAMTYYRELNEYDSAQVYFSHVRRIARNIDHFSQEGECNLYLASIVYKRNANYLESERYAQRAIECFDAIGAAVWSAQAELERIQRWIYTRQTDEAIVEIHELAQRYRDLDDPVHEAYCVYALGEAFYNKSLYDSAMYYADSSRRLRLDLLDDGRIDEADLAATLNCMALVNQALKQYAVAESLLTKADELLSSDKSLARQRLLNRLRRASNYLESKRFHKARNLFKGVMAETDERYFLIPSLFGLGVSEYESGLIDPCRHYLRRCIQMVEEGRKSIPANEIRQGVLADHINAYNLMAVTYIEEFERTNDTSNLDTALTYVEMSISRVLRERFQSREHTEETQWEKRLLSEIASLKALELTGGSPVSKLNDSLKKLNEARRNKQLESNGTLRSSALTLSETFDALKSVRASLESEEWVAEFLLSPFGSFRFDITADAIDVTRLPYDLERFRKHCDSYAQFLQTYPRDVVPPDSVTAIARGLERAILHNAPTDNAVNARLIIIPSDCLFGFPVSALVDSIGRYLVESHEIVYLPSLVLKRNLHGATGSVQHARAIAAFGNPHYRSESLPLLQHSEREVDTIARLFPERPIRRFTENDALKSRFLALDSSTLDILHVAAHGWVDRHRIGRTGIIFGIEGEENREGLLIPQEISALHLTTNLTFLSACGSGDGLYLPGEGQISLVAPFLLSGSKSVVASLWKVDDRASTEIVAEFYRHYKLRSSAAPALRLAKMHMLSHDRRLFRHPYFWASYTVTGLN